MKHLGFSRLEIVVLTAAAGIVGSFLVPVLAQNGPKAAHSEGEKEKVCLYQLKVLGLGFMQYVQDYDERFPPAAIGPKAGKPSEVVDGGFTYSTPYGWADALWPYIRAEANQCPSEINVGHEDATKPGYTDYWMNTNVARRNFAAFRTVSQTILCGDGDGGAGNSNARYNLNALPKSWLSTPGSPARRHKDAGNYLFADGHVKRVAAGEISLQSGDKHTFAVQ